MPKLTKAETAEREECIAKLREWLPPGSTVYCVLTHVSRSGMQREIKLYARIEGQDQLQYLSGYVSHVLDYARRGKRDGNVVDGCGMDMGFHLVYGLGAKLYPDGFDCLGLDKRCPGNDHYKQETRRRHSDGGYALRCEWL